MMGFATLNLIILKIILYFLIFFYFYRLLMSSTAVPALDKTFQILDLITDSSQPLTAAHIAKELGLPRS
ncbi:helix-turn-helix domain-containing protein, partial [Psychrobacter sp. SIMBA_152]